jgi:hypothetical protein
MTEMHKTIFCYADQRYAVADWMRGIGLSPNTYSPSPINEFNISRHRGYRPGWPFVHFVEPPVPDKLMQQLRDTGATIITIQPSRFTRKPI